MGTDRVAQRRRELAEAVVRQAAPLLAGGAAGEAYRERMRAAFAAVPREVFLGPPPWRMHAGEGGGGAILLREPAQVYQDQTIALAPERGINNGQPSLHARSLAALNVIPGEAVAHIGAGTGYYTAILAELVGAAGRVEAFEIEADLARAAAANLARYPQVRVHARSGAAPPLPSSDVIYVNAGAPRPLKVWLEALRPRGRLLFPLTGELGAGAMLWIARGEGAPPWPARFLDPVLFIACVGAPGAGNGAPLAPALERKDLHRVRSLHLGTTPDDSAWLAGDGWWLSTAPA